MKPFATTLVVSLLSLTIPISAQDQNFPEKGHSNDNGGIFGVGVDILFSGFISLDKISGTLGLGSEFPPLSELLPGVTDILTGNQQPGGSGPYPAKWFTDPELPNHTIYAPASPPVGVQLPVIVWGNGFCINVGNSYQPFLQEIASHGYLVIASGPPLPKIALDPLTLITTTGLQSKSIQLTQAIDFVYAGKASKYGSIDTSRLAAAGQSCGGQEAYSASYHDPRVVLTMLFNSGVFIPARRYLLSELTAPVAYFCGGPIDLSYEISLADYALLPQGLPSVWSSLDTGHAGTYFAENGGKDAQAAVTFLQWWFRGDEAAKQKFTDPSSAGSLAGEGWNVTMKNVP
jgi:hypothetical protein